MFIITRIWKLARGFLSCNTLFGNAKTLGAPALTTPPLNHPFYSIQRCFLFDGEARTWTYWWWGLLTFGDGGGWIGDCDAGRAKLVPVTIQLSAKQHVTIEVYLPVTQVGLHQLGSFSMLDLDLKWRYHVQGTGLHLDCCICVCVVLFGNGFWAYIFFGNINCILCLIVAFVCLLRELWALHELPWDALVIK